MGFGSNMGALVIGSLYFLSFLGPGYFILRPMVFGSHMSALVN